MANPREEAMREQFLTTMASLLAGDSARVYTADVELVGDKIILPEGANIPEVCDVLMRKHSYLEQKTQIHSILAVPPWDGAYALVKAIEETIGVTVQKEGMGGAHQIDVEVELGKTISVPWGAFELTGMEKATVSTDATFEDGRLVFVCHVTCKRRYEDRVRRLLDKVREIATRESLHKGKAFSMKFRDDDGDALPLPMPKFFPFIEEEPIFSRTLENQIERNVLVPIKKTNEMIAMGESLKRGVLFAGQYGVGKTLLASHLAKLATANGWTFVYVKDSAELGEALAFAQHYQPVVVFAEDVDRVAGEKRDDDVNDLLNQLDGIDGKKAQIITILTSNHPDSINPAMRRPGRIDVVLEVQPPDPEAVERMIRTFAGPGLSTTANLSGVGAALAGQIPAVIREVVSRSKLEMLRRTGLADGKIMEADILTVTEEVKTETNLFRRDAEKKEHSAAILGEALTSAGDAVRRVADRHGVGATH